MYICQSVCIFIASLEEVCGNMCFMSQTILTGGTREAIREGHRRRLATETPCPQHNMCKHKLRGVNNLAQEFHMEFFKECRTCTCIRVWCGSEELQ